MSYKSTQLLTTTLNIEQNKITGNINQLILNNIKKRYEGVCNKDGYIEKGSIKLVNRSIGKLNLIDNKSIILYNITYEANIISPSDGLILTCIINSNNKMGLIGYIKNKEGDTLEDSPFIIIVPREYFKNEDTASSINDGDSIEVEIIKSRTKYLAKQIQLVAKPV